MTANFSVMINNEYSYFFLTYLKKNNKIYFNTKSDKRNYLGKKNEKFRKCKTLIL